MQSENESIIRNVEGKKHQHRDVKYSRICPLRSLCLLPSFTSSQNALLITYSHPRSWPCPWERHVDRRVPPNEAKKKSQKMRIVLKLMQKKSYFFVQQNLNFKFVGLWEILTNLIQKPVMFVNQLVWRCNQK